MKKEGIVYKSVNIKTKEDRDRGKKEERIEWWRQAGEEDRGGIAFLLQVSWV